MPGSRPGRFGTVESIIIDRLVSEGQFRSSLHLSLGVLAQGRNLGGVASESHLTRRHREVRTHGLAHTLSTGPGLSGKPAFVPG